MSDLGAITFKLDKNGATLTVTGPGTSVGPAKVNPSIGVRRDSRGRYQFVVGNKQSVVAPAKLPRQIRAALKSFFAGRSKSASNKIHLPGVTDLLQSGSGKPGFISYAEYNNQRVSRLANPGQATWWPVLTEIEYNSLVCLYKLLLAETTAKADLPKIPLRISF